MKLKTALAYLFILIMILNCKQVYDVDISQPGDETNPYHVFFINRTLDEDLGVIVTDTNKREINLFYGDKDSKGSLVNIQQIITYLPEHKLLVNFDLDENLLPQTITSVQNDTITTFKFKNYDLRANTVDIDIFDTQNTLLQNRMKVWCGDGLVKLKEAKKQLDAGKGLRLTAETGLQDKCTFLNSISTAANGIGCIAGAAATLVSIPAIATGFGAALVALEAYFVVNTCQDFHEGITGIFRGECLESLDWQDQAGTTFNCAKDRRKFLKFAEELAVDVAAGKRKEFIKDVIGCLSGMIDATAKIIKEKFNSPKPPESSFPPTSEVYPEAKSFGDPNIVTFDGKSYGFNGVGEFIATKSTTDHFEVQVRQEELKSRNSSGSVSWNTGLAINTGSDKLCFYPTNYYINQTLYNYASSINHTLQNGGSIIGNSKEFMVSIGNSDVVKVFNRNDSFDYSIIPSIKRQGKMIGVFGNFDKQPSNDLQIRNGAQIDGSYGSLYPNFANSWRIAQNQSLFVYEAGKNTSSYTDLNFPRTPLVITSAQRANAEQVCKNAGVVAPFLEGCINDVVATGDNSFANRSKELQDEKVLRSFNIDFGNADRSLYSWNSIITTFEENYALVEPSYLTSLITKNAVAINAGFETTLYISATKNGSSSSIVLSIGGGTSYFRLSIDNDDSPLLFDGKIHKINIALSPLPNSSGKGYKYIAQVDNVTVINKIPFEGLPIVDRLGIENDCTIKFYQWSFKSY